MTAAERAAVFSWAQCPGGEGHDVGDEGFAYTCAKCHTDLIVAAEDEAIERVALSLWEDAKVAEEMGSHERAQALAFASKNVRSLKSTGSGK